MKERENGYIRIEGLRLEKEMKQFIQKLGISDFLLNLSMRRREGRNNNGDLNGNGNINSIGNAIIGKVNEK